MAKTLAPVLVENGFSVAMAMTGAAFTAAQENRIVALEPDIDAMHSIAEHIGESTPLPPLVFFTRWGGEGYRNFGSWDEKWPVCREDARKARFFSATRLEFRDAPSGTQEEVIDYARGIGATIVAEMTVADWDKSLVGPFATALLFGKRPVDLPQRLSWLERRKQEVVAAFTDDPVKQRKLSAAKNAQPPLPEPFRITRGKLTEIPPHL